QHVDRFAAPAIGLPEPARSDQALAVGTPVDADHEAPSSFVCAPRPAGPQPRDGLRLRFPVCAPRPAGPQPRDGLRLRFPVCAPRPAGPQPRDGLRLRTTVSRGRTGRRAAVWLPWCPPPPPPGGPARPPAP